MTSAHDTTEYNSVYGVAIDHMTTMVYTNDNTIKEWSFIGSKMILSIDTMVEAGWKFTNFIKSTV